MLITFERVWAVGPSDVRRIVFSSCHNNHELEQSPTDDVFEQFRAHKSATCLKGVKSCQKGVLPKLSRDGGVYPRASIPKRGTWSHPTFDHSRSPAIYTLEKKKKLPRCLGGAQGARQTLQILIWSEFDGEHGRRRRRKALPPLSSRFLGGCTPFGQMLKKNVHTVFDKP